MLSFSSFSLKNYESLHWIFLLLVLIFLLTISSFHQIGGYNVETDFYGSYAPNVHKMLHGGKYYDEDHGPGYIFPLIIFYLIIGDVFIAGKLLSVISSVLFILFTFLTIKTLYNTRYGFYTSLLLFLLVARHSILASTDMFFAFVVSLSIYLIFRDYDFTMRNLFWGGLVAGYAIMTRLNAIILPAGVIFALLFVNSSKWGWKQRVKAAAIFLAACFLGSFPWYVMNMVYYGKPFFSEAHQTLGASLLSKPAANAHDFAWGAEKQKIANQYHSLLGLMVHNLPLILKTIFKNIPHHFRSMLSFTVGFPGYLFVAPGIMIALVHANKTHLTFFVFPTFGFLIYTIVDFIPRFYIYLLGFLSLFIVCFLFDTDLFKSKNKAKNNFAIVTGTVFFLILLFTAQKAKYDITNIIKKEPRHIIEVANMLNKVSQDNDRIFARKPHLGYFSKRKTIVFPDVDNLKNLIDAAQKEDVQFIYYGVIESQLRPKLNILQNPQQVYQRLDLIYKRENPPCYLYKIRKVNPAK